MAKQIFQLQAWTESAEQLRDGPELLRCASACSLAVAQDRDELPALSLPTFWRWVILAFGPERAGGAAQRNPRHWYRRTAHPGKGAGGGREAQKARPLGPGPAPLPGRKGNADGLSAGCGCAAPPAQVRRAVGAKPKNVGNGKATRLFHGTGS
jgi:hypothetical protein